jgi:hypothetical protein
MTLSLNLQFNESAINLVVSGDEATLAKGWLMWDECATHLIRMIRWEHA